MCIKNIAAERRRCMADLKEYFPMIRERKEVMEEIGKKDSLRVMFASWTEEQQEEVQLQGCKTSLYNCAF